MTLIDFLILLLIAGVCGAIGKALIGFPHGGFLMSIGVGFVGAAIGSWFARQLALPGIIVLDAGNTGFPVVWATIGSILSVAIIGAFMRLSI